MSNPQQPEVARSRKTPAQDPDAAAGVIDGQKQPATGGPEGPVPEDNQPGHHPPQEQDKPDLQDFAERLGTAPPENRSDPSPDRSADRSPAAAVSAAVRSRSRAGVGAAVAVLAGLAGMLLLKRRRTRK